MTDPPTATVLPLPLLRQGKVREVYEVDEAHVLLVASDRISAFDLVLDQPIPCKGTVLTQISAYWFQRLSSIIGHHCVSADAGEITRRVPVLVEHREALEGRAMLARRATPIPFECVVRGYLSGSAWKEYRAHGTLAGEALPAGLVESDRFPSPIFSPATKAETGHDENVTYDDVVRALGPDLAHRLREASFALYEAGRRQSAERGLIIADTKFEFGHDPAGRLLVIDEVLTPDSSRFWAADDYAPGRSQRSFDKQPMRDYLAHLREAGRWNGEAPPPPLSEAVVAETSARYRDAYARITGTPLSGCP